MGSGVAVTVTTLVGWTVGCGVGLIGAITVAVKVAVAVTAASAVGDGVAEGGSMAICSDERVEVGLILAVGEGVGVPLA